MNENNYLSLIDFQILELIETKNINYCLGLSYNLEVGYSRIHGILKDLVTKKILLKIEEQGKQIYYLSSRGKQIFKLFTKLDSLL